MYWALALMDFANFMKILICTNGKKHSEEAIRFAGNLFSTFEPKITLLFIGQNSMGELAGRVGNEILGKFKLKADIKIKESRDIATEIVKEAEVGAYDLLVLGSRGASSTIPGVSNYVLGDIPREVIKEVKVSTLIVKEPEEVEKVLIAVNGSEASREAALFWGLVAKKNKRKWREQKIHLVTVVPELYNQFSDELGPLAKEQLDALSRVSNEYTRPAYQIKMALHEKHGVESRVRLREGEISEEILQEADRDYDLIVLGRDETKRHTFGTHLASIVEQAEIPVLVVRRDTIKKAEHY